MSFDLEIKAIIVLCKLSNGDIHSINTDRETECELLGIIEKNKNGITLSPEKISGIDIELPL